jgi:hypothetical protein
MPIQEFANGNLVSLPEAWGAASYPLDAAKLISLEKRLVDVPRSGTVVDIGAGIELSLASAIFIYRPDIYTIIHW